MSTKRPARSRIPGACKFALTHYRVTLLGRRSGVLPVSSSANEPYIVSVDDHLIEPPSLWASRLPAKLRSRGPRAVETAEGIFWELDGERIPLSGIAASAGTPLEERRSAVRWEDLRPGCYDPVERVKDMDVDGLIASLCFPSMPGFGGTQFNRLKAPF